MAQPSILSAGAKVGGKYEVVEVIGFGGMGLVYKVREQVGAVSRIRALKTVLPQYGSDAGIMARFRQEAEKMCMLEHENIVPVLSYSEEGEFPYLVMPFIEGQTLKDYLASHVTQHGRGLPLSEVMEIGVEVLRALEVAHGFVNPETRRPQPMVHRDIKPGNVMVRVENQGGERRMKVLIMDFGIAKVMSAEDSGHTLTEVIGTVKYASPEQIRRGKDIDPRADIYSLGMVLFELYAGRHMFAGLSEHSVLMRMMQRDVQDHPISFPDETPQRFRQLIQRCVAVEREQRFASVKEMHAIMRRILDEDSERGATEAENARGFAATERARAVSAGAAEFAATKLGEGDELLAQGDAAIAGRQFKEAVPALRAAVETFARAVEDVAEARERSRLREGLSSLSGRRAAALAVNAEKLAAAQVSAAEQATQALEKAIAANDLTAGARALAQAERAWREAETRASQERQRLEAMAACERLEAAISAHRADLARLPARLRQTAGAADLGPVEASAKAAREAVAAGDFAGARASVDEASSALSALERRRSETLARTVGELTATLSARLAAVESSPDVELAAAAHAEVRAAAERAKQLAERSQLVEAATELEQALSAVEQLEKGVAERVAERERRLQAAEQNRRAEPAARQALEKLAQARAQLSAAGAPRGAEVEDLREAAALAATGERELADGEFADSLPRLRSAAERLARLAATIAAREEQERLAARLSELRRRATTLSQELGALGPEARNASDGRRLLASFASAEEQANRADLASAIRTLEASVPELERHIAETRAELERARRRTEAESQQRRATATMERATRTGDPATHAPVFAAAKSRIEEGARALAAEDFSLATTAFAEAAQALETLLADIDRAERLERLAALSRRRDAVVEKIGALPSSRSVQRRRKAITKSLAAVEAALGAGDEPESARRLSEIETWVQILASDASTQSANATSEIPWRTVGAGAGAAAALVAVLLLVLVRSKNPTTSEPETTDLARSAPATPTVVPVVPRAAPSPEIAVVPQVPTAAPAVEPTAESTSPPSIAAVEPPVLEATAPPLPVPVEPTAPPPPPLALASAKPAAKALRIVAGTETRFEASLKNPQGASLEWRLAGEPVGRGRSLILGRDRTATPGRSQLELVAERDAERVSLRTWDLQIEPPPLGFAKLEPAARSVERPSGTPISFHAPIKDSDGEKLSFVWQVNGETARGIDGPAYEFRPNGPGEYLVQVSATAPWGASIANTWKLSVKPPPPPTPAVVEELKRPLPSDPRGEAQVWIQQYCRAFERKDTDALLALGHLASQAEASRLRDALAAMNNLQVSCSNPSVSVSGDQAEVSFDRTDHWTDPRGTEMERALPRITKTLRRSNGRWVAAP